MGQDAFFDYVKRIGSDTELKNVILPMSVGKSIEGAYQIEELLQGNMRVFVRKLMNTGGQSA